MNKINSSQLDVGAEFLARYLLLLLLVKCRIIRCIGCRAEDQMMAKKQRKLIIL